MEMLETLKDRFASISRPVSALEREELAEMLAACKTQEADQFLVKQLASEQWHFRHNAALLLQGRPATAVPVLREALLSDNEDLVYWGSKILPLIDPQGEEFLSQKYNSTDRVTVKLFILRALSGSRNPDVIALFISCLVTGPWVIRDQAAACLEASSTAAVDPLLKAFESYTAAKEDSPVCSIALSVLTRIQGAEMMPFLQRKSRSKRDVMRYFAISAMREIAGEESVKAWVKALSDNSLIVRRLAEELLMNAGAHAVPVLKAAFKKADSDRKYVIIRILGHISHQSSITSLLSILRSAVPEMRYYALAALGEIGVECLPYLINAFNDDVEILRTHSSMLIQEKIGTRAIGRLKATVIKESDNPEQQHAIAWCLKTLSGLWPESIDALLSIAESAEYPTNLQALNTIKDVDVRLETSPRRLAAFIRSERWLIRRTAADMLGRYGALALPELLDELVLEGDPETSFWLREILQEIPGDIIEPLSRIYNEADGEGQRAVKRLLADMGNKLIKDNKSIPDYVLKSDRYIREHVLQALQDKAFEDDIKWLVESVPQAAPVHAVSRLECMEIIMNSTSWGADGTMFDLWNSMLRAAVRDNSVDDAIRAKALDTLVRSGTGDMISLMIQFKDHLDRELMEQLKQSLEFEEGRAAGELLWENYRACKTEEDAAQMLEVISKAELDKASLMTVARELGSRDFSRREKAEEVLETSPEESLQAVIDVYFEDDDWFIRKNLVTCLRRLYFKHKLIYLKIMGTASGREREVLERATLEEN